jgi:hypothetical protein
MAIVNSRATLINYSLRQLGYPVVEINVDNDQIEDRIDDAVQLYQEFHHDSMHREYLQYQITQQDIDNKYISLPDEVLYIVMMFSVSSSWIDSRNMFSFQYQFALSDFHTLGQMGGGLDYYAQTKQYMETLDMVINGTPQITFARLQNRLYLWGDLGDGVDIKVGDWIMLEAYVVIDPGAHAKIYNDMFIKAYTTQLIKYQWGTNLSKFEGIQLPGGITVNGTQKMEEAMGQMEMLRERMRSEHEEPVDFFIG